MTIKEIAKTKEALPREAFALVGNSEDTTTWHLPHHKKNILKAIRGKLDMEETVDWPLMATAVGKLSLGVNRRRKIEADPEQILVAAAHLASHYRQAGHPLPDVLAALV